MSCGTMFSKALFPMHLHLTGELTEAGHRLRLTNLWASYQQFLLPNQTDDKPVEGVNPLNFAPNKRKLIRNINVGNQQRRKLLNIHEMEIGLVDDEQEDQTEPKFDSFIQNVDIQPESGKLLPWEKGTFDDVQKVKYL